MRTTEGPGGRRLSRAEFLRLSGVTATAVLLGTGELQSGRAYAAPSFTGDPFSLGVASGDPRPTSVLLWTRLAPDPLAEDDLFGMSPAPVRVRYEVAKDEGFRRVVDRGAVTATPELAHSVHVEARWLRPGYEYFYRFKAGAEISPVGRTRTTPVGRVDRLRFALAGCQRWQEGFYAAHRAIAADEELDLVVFSGDYIYENGFTAVRDQDQPVAGHLKNECFELGHYRRRYALHKVDPDLQEAHRKHPWLVTWDDHEVDDNYAGLFPTRASETAAFPARRAAAYQAFYEHMPLRRSSAPAGPDLPLYRSVRFGRLADFRLLDGRQYRSDQVCRTDGPSPPCPASLDPARTMLGAAQEAWLLDDLDASRADWNVIAQQTIMCRADREPGPELLTSMDNWNGYAPARQRLFDGVAERRVQNLVVLTGDAHCSLAAELRLQYDDPESPGIGAEIVGTSVSSGGNGDDVDARGEEFLGSNPHIRFYNARRGYVSCDVTRDAWHSDFMALPYVLPGDAVPTKIASFVTEAGVPGLRAA